MWIEAIRIDLLLCNIDMNTCVHMDCIFINAEYQIESESIYFIIVCE